MNAISVIIPCFNYGRFLADAIESVLRQRTADLEVEIIVVDDGSTDETRSVALSFGSQIRYVFKDNQGISAARNTGMALASYDLVSFLDADDCLVDGALANLLNLWDSLDPKPGFLASRNLEVDEWAENPIGPDPPTDGSINPVSTTELVIASRFCTTGLAETKFLLGIGGFDTTLGATEDRDLWLRVAAKRKVLLANCLTLRKRNHGSNISTAAAHLTSTMERLLEKAFSNPELDLTSWDRRYAWAVCHYRSALMYADAGEHATALSRMFRSLIASPFGRGDFESIPRFGRLRGSASLVLKLLGGRRCRKRD